jgi:predicted DNA-binding protein
LYLDELLITLERIMAKPGRTIFAKSASFMPGTTRSANLRGKAGRKPTGPGGEKVSEYPHVMIRLPRQTKDTLDALSGTTGVPVWQLVDRAIACYVGQLPAAEQKLVADVKNRRARLSTES